MAYAAGVIYQAEGKILLLRRRADKINGGTWNFPAGKIEQGESPEIAAAREFAEEAGRTIEMPVVPVPAPDNFALFYVQGSQFPVVLNDEHTEFMWADPLSLPSPLHPHIADQVNACFGRTEAMDYAETARQYDRNGYVLINKNPITRAGVFTYSGKVLPDADPNRSYSVYRPLEELTQPETLESFKLLPILNDHEMVGGKYARGAEERGVHGSTGEDISVAGNDILSTLRIFSRSLKSLVESGKKALSLGYGCRFEKIDGVFNGIAYNYIQRDIRGNHLALVNEGRSGTEVLDHHWACDEVDLALDNEEKTMPELEKEVEAKDTAEAGAEPEMTLKDISAAIKAFGPLMAQVQEFMAAAVPAKAAEVALDAEEEETKEEKAKEKKEDAMDSAEVSKLNARIANLESGVSVKTLKAELAATNALASQVAQHVGSFDHSAMDEAEVVAYGVAKLGLTAAKGQERAVLEGFIAGKKAASGNGVGFAMDSAFKPKTGGLLSKRLGAKA